MSARHANPARIVFDPAVPPRELRALRAADAARVTLTAPARHLPHAADRAVAAYLTAATGAAAVQLALPGVPWAWAWFLADTALLASVTTAAARVTARRYRGRYVNPGWLDPASRQVLARAQAAISAILGARICRDGYLDTTGGGAVLGDREWEVASMLARACALDAALAEILDGAPAAPAQEQVLRRVRNDALQRVTGLEEYARQVQAADAAYRAHAAAGPLADLGDSFLDLLAVTADSQQARGEVLCLHAEAALAEQALRAS